MFLSLGSYYSYILNSKRTLQHLNFLHWKFCLHQRIEDTTFIEVKLLPEGIPPRPTFIPEVLRIPLVF